MIKWIVDVCEHAEIPIKPVVNLTDIIEVVQFTRERERKRQQSV